MLGTESGSGVSHRFGNLRGVQWRIDFGILPSAPSASVEDLRRVTANSRRRYAALRKQLLVDPHVPKDGSSSPDVVMDNPLSQNPDSMWGRFFRNAELERMVDQDLTRLYPERGSYFQTNGCQYMLRRILLLWCLRHPECGYRQGMHELLAPLLYVLNVDMERLSDVRKTYEDHFTDNFDGFAFHESDLTYKFDFKKFSESMDHGDDLRNSSTKAGNLSELDQEIQMIVLLSDAYGAEGELGIVLSEKFMEHDAYCMFDALMSGAGGAVAMAEFFSPSPVGSSQTGFPPVIEASAALYHLLSIVDSSLHSHLVELGVEPQYFALRWLRVLFGREFSLEDLLVIWDEIFACENIKCGKAINADAESNFGILESSRGAFICALSVSMILNLRSSLLATENATTCLQRLLNFPDDVKLVKLLEKAKSLHPLALDSNSASLMPTYAGLYERKNPVGVRGHSLSVDASSSPKTPLSMVSDGYWEEKWRVLQKEEESKKGGSGEQVPNRRKGWTERVKMRLSRTESAPSPSQESGRNRIHKPSVRRSLLKDLERQLGLTEDNDDNTTCCADLGVNEDKENKENTDDVGLQYSSEVSKEDVTENNSSSLSFAGSEENVYHFSYLSSPVHGNSDNENELDRRSSVASNSSVEENDAESSGAVSECLQIPVSDTADDLSLKGSHNDVSVGTGCSTISVSDAADDLSLKGSQNDVSVGTGSSTISVSDTADDLSLKGGSQNNDPVGKSATDGKDRRHILGKFQWLWKFGRNGGDEISERSAPEGAKACNGASGDQNNAAAAAVVVSDAKACNGDRSNATGVTKVEACNGKGETVDQNVMVSLKNIGQSMLENIQVIESVFQQDRGSVENSSKNVLVGKGQVTAMAALTELRKISNLLSEM